MLLAGEGSVTTRYLVAPALVLASCATTSLTSVRDPAFQGRAFQRIVVVAPFTDLEKKATAENAFVAALQRQGAQAVPGMTVLPPTRDYSNDDINAALQAAGASGVLFVTLTDASMFSTYVPGSTTTTGSGHGTATTYGSTTTGTVDAAART